MTGAPGPSGPAGQPRGPQPTEGAVTPLARSRRAAHHAGADADRSLDALLLAVGIPIGIALGLLALALLVLLPVLLVRAVS